MLKTSLLRLAPLAVLVALSLSLSGVGLSGAGLTGIATPVAPDAAAQLTSAPSAELFAVPSFAAGPITNICPGVYNGCTSEGIACNGYSCCCIYSCPDGTGYAAFCRRTNPSPF